MECHTSGVPHINLPLWFTSRQEQHDFLHILETAYSQAYQKLPGTSRSRPTIHNDPQAIVYKEISNSLADARSAIGYAYKHVRHTADRTILSVDDRAWCRLWSIRQFSTWGVPSAQEYQALAKCSNATKALKDADQFPSEITSLLNAASDKRYSDWLSATHPRSSSRYAIVNSNTITLLSGPRLDITLSKPNILCRSLASLHLRETYPTPHCLQNNKPPARPPTPISGAVNQYFKESRGI